MSEETPGGKTDVASGNTDQVSYDSYKKLLGEKKKLQDEMSTIRATKDQLEQEKLQAEGQWKELAEKNKKLAEDFKSKNLNIVKQVSEKAIRSQFLREAEKLGCIDSELAMKACSFEDVELTEDFEFDQTKLVLKIQDLTKTKPHLFKKDFKLPPDVTPGVNMSANQSLTSLSDSDLKSLLKNAK